MHAGFFLENRMTILIVGTLHASLRMPAVPVLLIMHFKYRENHNCCVFQFRVVHSRFCSWPFWVIHKHMCRRPAFVNFRTFQSQALECINLTGVYSTSIHTCMYMYSSQIQWSEGPPNGSGHNEFQQRLSLNPDSNFLHSGRSKGLGTPSMGAT